MRDELFREIGKIQDNEKASDKAETDKIYDMVTKKLADEKRKKSRRKVIALIASFAATATVLCVCIYSFANRNSDVESTTDKASVETTNASDVVVEPQERMAVSISAAGDKTGRNELKEGEKVDIGKYNTLWSSVPGYQITVSDKAAENNKASNQIRIMADKGVLLTWNKSTGEVQELGKVGNFEWEENVYWSPLENDKLCDEATIMVQLLDGDEVIETTKMHITETKEGEYVAEKLNL